MFQLKSVKCGRKECKKCPHEGYLYRATWEYGKTKVRYLGKLIKVDLDKLYNTEFYNIEGKRPGMYGKIQHEDKIRKLRREIKELEKQKKILLAGALLESSGRFVDFDVIHKSQGPATRYF